MKDEAIATKDFSRKIKEEVDETKTISSLTGSGLLVSSCDSSSHAFSLRTLLIS